MHQPMPPTTNEQDVDDVYRYPLWFCFRALPLMILGAIIILLLTISPVRAQDTEVVTPNGVQAGQMLFHDRDTGLYTAAIMQHSKAHFDISGMIAQVRLEQTFVNNSGQWVEAIYAFPLPETGAVKAMEMRVGERRIVGEIAEKSLAKKIYQQARMAGKKAALVEQQRPNLFTNRVANIGPGETIVVRLNYVQQVEFSSGEFSLRFPMTITPRYIPGVALLDTADDEPESVLDLNPYLGWAQPTDQVTDADAVTPLLHPDSVAGLASVNIIELTAQLDAGMPLAKVDSSYHELTMSRSSNRYDIRLAKGFSQMDRDFVLIWQAVTGATPQAAVFTETVNGEHYGLLMVIPPALVTPEHAQQIHRETIFVIDTSGSMGGVSIAEARQSLDFALTHLRSKDSFNIIEFNTSHRLLYRAAVPASRHNVQRAREYVRQLNAGGGTEMLGALRAALSFSASADGHGLEAQALERIRQVVFITDGAVGNEQALYREITEHLGPNRLFTVGIGSAPNSWFMRKAAQFGRGTYVQIGDLNEVGNKMSALFEKISNPVVANIEIQWPIGVEAFPAKISDLYKGEPLLVAVKSGRRPMTGEISIRGDMAGKPWTRRLRITDTSQSVEAVATHSKHPGVATLWARRKITSLLDELVTGKAASLVRGDVLAVALSHRLMSPYTSFVAVEQRITRPSNAALVKAFAANTQPKGQSAQSFAYPKTATTAAANLFFGGLFLFVAMMVYVMRREEVDHVSASEV
jgi:Ca-activated chloride channel family protein